jgi:hypothetical protein
MCLRTALPCPVTINEYVASGQKVVAETRERPLTYIRLFTQLRRHSRVNSGNSASGAGTTAVLPPLCTAPVKWCFHVTPAPPGK